jgi:hypothetical protein
MASLGPLTGRSNLREVVAASSGVTYLLSPAKAQDELGFTTRDIEAGLRDTFGAGANAAA